MTKSIFFKDNHFVKIENLISKETASLLYKHVKNNALRCLFLEETQKQYDKNIYGMYEDGQCKNAFALYGDSIFDDLLEHIKFKVEDSTGYKLIPTYTYHRLYLTGSELERHKDRMSCDISGTLYLGSDIDNLKNKNYTWPMYVGTKDGAEGTKGISVDLNPGDAILYRGTILEHWRDKFLGNNHAQVFLHYNEDVEKNRYRAYDSRPVLGLPSNFRQHTPEELGD